MIFEWNADQTGNLNYYLSDASLEATPYNEKPEYIYYCIIMCIIEYYFQDMAKIFLIFSHFIVMVNILKLNHILYIIYIIFCFY